MNDDAMYGREPMITYPPYWGSMGFMHDMAYLRDNPRPCQARGCDCDATWIVKWGFERSARNEYTYYCDRHRRRRDRKRDRAYPVESFRFALPQRTISHEEGES